ncbi:hypothetical protein CDP76_21850 [Salmonella enterica]|nr:hypothetical protein [Salmonella enterica]
MFYFYIPGSYSVLEPVKMDGNTSRGEYSGETLEQLQVINPHVVMLHINKCVDAIRDAAKMPVEAISKNTFDLFQRAKIMDEYHSNGGCTFKCREFIAADIVTCFASVTVNDQPMCAMFRDVDSLTHEQILSRVCNFYNSTMTVTANPQF